MFYVPGAVHSFRICFPRLTMRYAFSLRNSPVFEPAPGGLPFCISLSDSHPHPLTPSPRGAPSLCTFPPSCPVSHHSRRSGPTLIPPCQADSSRMYPLSRFTPPAGYVEYGLLRRSETHPENHGSLVCTLDSELVQCQAS